MVSRSNDKAVGTPIGTRTKWLSMKGLVSAAVASALLLGATGCGRLKQQVKESMDSNPQMRQGAVDSARKSCVQTAMAKVPKVPGIETKVQNYCDCFATKGLGKFSNSELASIGFHGGHFTQEQQVKLNEAVQMCSSTLLEHTPGGTER